MLTLNVRSFSYKSGVPFSDSEHGGGFAFDVRCLPNPGREQQYKTRTGQDQDVIDYLEACEEVETFYKNCKLIVEQAVNNFREREFDSLFVCFGCTGGQHRSVYFAERIAREFADAEVEIELSHCQLPTILKDLGRAE